MTEHPWVARARRAGDRLTVFAHRGGAGLAPENTRGAFRQAAALGVDGCELDVRLSKDGEVVVIHDATLDRTTDADGPVSALTAAELGRVDAGFRFGADAGFPWRGRGEGVPRLADVLADHPALPFIIEVKGDDPAVAEAAAAVVARAGALDRVCFGGFSRRDAGGACAPRSRPRAPAPRPRRSAARSTSPTCGGRPAASPYQAFQVPEIVERRHARRLAALRPPGSPRRPRAARLDGEHAGRHRAAEGVGRRRRDHRPPGRGPAVRR